MFSDYTKDKIRRHIFGTASWTKPSALYIALMTIAPTSAGGGTEAVGASYARIRRDPLDANWTFVGTDEANNTADLIWNPPTESWGNIVALAVYDASPGGNMIVFGNLKSPKTINSGDPAPKFSAGTLRSLFQ